MITERQLAEAHTHTFLQHRVYAKSPATFITSPSRSVLMSLSKSVNLPHTGLKVTSTWTSPCYPVKHLQLLKQHYCVSYCAGRHLEDWTNNNKVNPSHWILKLSAVAERRCPPGPETFCFIRSNSTIVSFQNYSKWFRNKLVAASRLLLYLHADYNHKNNISPLWK